MSTTPVPSDDNEDFDIYGDLSECNIPREHSKQTSQSSNEECQFLKKQVAELQSQIADLRNNNEKLKIVNNNLSCNVSVLLKTATAEIERKDNTISELRKELDNFLFRRKNKKLSAGCGDGISSKQSNSKVDVNTLKESLRYQLDGSEISTVSCTPIQTVNNICLPKVVDSSSKEACGRANHNSGHGNDSSLVKDKEVCNIKDVKVQNTIKEVPKKRKILECSYNSEEKSCVEKPLKLSVQAADPSSDDAKEFKKSVWARLGYRSEPTPKSRNDSLLSTKESAGAHRSPATAKDNLNIKSDHLTSAFSGSKSHCNSKNHELTHISPVEKPSASVTRSSLNKKADQKKKSSGNSDSCAVKTSKVPDPPSVDTARLENISPKSKVTKNLLTNCNGGVSGCPPVVCVLPSNNEEALLIRKENSESVNHTKKLLSSSQSSSYLGLEQSEKDVETVQPPHDSTHEISLPSHMPKRMLPEEAATDVVPSLCPPHEEIPRSLPLVPSERPNSPVENSKLQAQVTTQPPLPKDDPAPLPPLPLTTPPATPVKRLLEQCQTPSESINEPVQNREEATEEPSSIKSSSAQNSPSASDNTNSKTDAKVPPRWSNENLLMQCPFKPRRRAKSVVVVEDKSDGKNNVSSQSSECSKSDASAKVSLALGKSPDRKYKKTPLKKSDIHDNRLASDFRPHQTQRSVYSSRHLSSVKSFAQLPERRSPSECLSGRSGRIERLTHGDKIRVRLRDRRSRSLSPQRSRVRQDEYRTRNYHNNASSKEVDKRNLVDNHDGRNTRSRDSKKTKSLSLRRKLPCQSEKEENIPRQKSQKIADLFGESSPEPEEKTSKRVNYASKRAHVPPINPSEEYPLKNISSSSSQKSSASPKESVSRSRKSSALVSAIDRRKKECAESTVASAPSSTNTESVVTGQGKEKSSTFPTESGDKSELNAISKNSNLENHIIVVRRRPRSSIKLENSEDKVHNINVNNINKPISSSTPLTDGKGAYPKQPEEMNKEDVKLARDQKKELKNAVARKLENTPLYFRERASKRSLSDDSMHDVDSMDESDDSSVNAGSDDTYNPKKSAVTKRRPTKRRK